jgi:hypothetical protein
LRDRGWGAEPLSLSDGALAALLDAARPIPPRDRDPFLPDIAAELAKANSLK